MGTDNLQIYLHDRLKGRFRSMVKYDRIRMHIKDLREDVKKQRLHSQLDRMIQRLNPEASAAEQNAFPLGVLHATLRYFDDAIVLHLPTSQRGGVVVSMESDVARQINSFVNACLQELQSFQRGDA